MQKFQDTVTGQEWHFELGVDVAVLQGVPSMLSTLIIPCPSESHDWAGSGWVLNAWKAWKVEQTAAQSALDRSDAVALRCWKAGVAFPAAWQAYTVQLRGIVTAATGVAGALPVQPAYPAGT